jgi:CHAT domain-containing protein
MAIRLSGAYQSLGFHRRALHRLEHVSEFVPGIVHKKALTARYFSRLSDVRLTLGDLAGAAAALEKAVAAAKDAGDPSVEAAVMNNVGNLLAVFDDFEHALAAYGEGLERFTAEGEAVPLALEARVVMNIVRTALLAGDFENVAAALEYAFVATENLPDGFEKTTNLLALSQLVRRIRANLADPDEELTTKLVTLAYRALEEARRISEENGDIRTLSFAFGYMGELYESQARIEDAMRLARRAIFHAQNAKAPESLYLWQWLTGRLHAANGDLAPARESFADALDTLEPIRHELLKGYRRQQEAFRETIKPVYLGMADLLLLEAETADTYEAREKKLIEARDTMERLKTAELQNFFQDECVTAMAEKMKKLDRAFPKTAILYPILLPDRLAILLTLPEGMKLVLVEVPDETVRETATRFRRRLQTRPDKRYLHDAAKLYDWLIRPLESELEAADVETLIVSPDGPLRLIPFSTFHDGERFLIESYAVATIPAVTLTDPKPFDATGADILLCGLSEGRHGFSPLPSVGKELTDIRKIMDGRVVLHDEAYTLERLTDQFKNNAYSIVHIATHGLFGATPENTFLLTYDTHLTIDRLEELISLSRFRKRAVELLTLSACQTALGDEQAALGLAGVAVKAGVRTAVATLWFVDDEATSLAVREFYRQLKKPGISKAKALQNAQMSLIAQKRYHHPAYWAPFLIIGNWQ